MPSAPNIAKHRGESTSGSRTALSADEFRALQAKVLEHVLATTEDVGQSFPDEARRIHNRKAPARPIRGQASLVDAKALQEDGIEIALLPTAPVPRDQLH